MNDVYLKMDQSKEERGSPGQMQLRIVVDTNLFIAAKFNTRSRSKRLISDCIEGKFRALYSTDVKEEIEAVVFKIPTHREFDPIVREFFKNAEKVEPEVRINVCRDAGDNRLVECAISGKADYVITNDIGVLEKDGYKELRIVNPSQFYRKAID